MALKEVKTEVIKVGKNLAIPLPVGFCDGTALKEGSELKIVYTKLGNFEIHMTDRSAGNLSCYICGRRTGKHTCSQCGGITCSNCFWEMGDLCKNCINK